MKGQIIEKRNDAKEVKNDGRCDCVQVTDGERKVGGLTCRANERLQQVEERMEENVTVESKEEIKK